MFAFARWAGAGKGVDRPQSSMTLGAPPFPRLMALGESAASYLRDAAVVTLSLYGSLLLRPLEIICLCHCPHKLLDFWWIPILLLLSGIFSTDSTVVRAVLVNPLLQVSSAQVFSMQALPSATKTWLTLVQVPSYTHTPVATLYFWMKAVVRYVCNVYLLLFPQ